MVEVTETVVCESLNSLPTDLVGFSTWLGVKMNLIPEGHRSTGQIEFNTYAEYDTASGDVTISYRRPQTEAELLARAERERQDRAQRERYERQQYEMLKARFEPSDKT